MRDGNNCSAGTRAYSGQFGLISAYSGQFRQYLSHHSWLADLSFKQPNSLSDSPRVRCGPSVVSHKYAYESAGPFGRRLRCSSSRGARHQGGDRRSPLQVIAPCRRPKCPRIFVTVFVRHHIRRLYLWADFNNLGYIEHGLNTDRKKDQVLFQENAPRTEGPAMLRENRPCTRS